MSQEERKEDEGPRETKVSASVRYFSEIGDKKRKKMRFIMALNGEGGPVHFYSKYYNQAGGVKKAKLEKSVIRVSPDGFSWIKVGGNDKKRLKKETVEASFNESTVYPWKTIITWDTHAKLEEFRIIFKNPNADLKKEEEERKKKEELLKKQQSKLRIMEKVPPGCVMYRFKSSMFKEISECVNETIMAIQRTYGLAQVDLEKREESTEEKKDILSKLPQLQVDESNRRRRNRSASLGSKDDSLPNSARSHGSNHAGQAGQANLGAGIPPPKRKHAGSGESNNNQRRQQEDRENIFMDSTYHPSTNNDMMSSYIPMADTFGGF